jgi:hypothetical protein
VINQQGGNDAQGQVFSQRTKRQALKEFQADDAQFGHQISN